jgi:glycosyltransferase involved in cell wall biosynthesis
MNRVSACLITLNEEANLPRALASLRGIVDEVVVVDSGSTDRTAEIARAGDAVFVQRPWTTYSDQKNYAAECASNEWILSVDADEELSSPLQSSLLSWKKQVPEFSVYEVSRKTWYLGKWIEHSGWYPDFQRRLYRRDQAEFSGLVHESLRFTGQLGRLSGDLLHYTVNSIDEHEANVERYSTLAAQQMFAEGKRNWKGALWIATPWSWFQNFVLRGGFMDGYRGAIIAKMAARSVRLKYSKLGRLVKSQEEASGEAAT